jgi:hypothetical protein
MDRPGSAAERGGTIQFIGEFEPTERQALEAQFSACRCELIARSSLDRQIVLLRWRNAGTGATRGPSPLFAAPSEAVYVLQPVEDPRGRTGLRRIDGDSDLAAAFPGHFPDVSLGSSFWRRLGDTWRRGVFGLHV